MLGLMESQGPGATHAEMQRHSEDCWTGRGVESGHAAAQGDFLIKRTWPESQTTATGDIPVGSDVPQCTPGWGKQKKEMSGGQ